MSDKPFESRHLVAVVALVSLIALGGCTSTAYVAAEAPVGIETYPRTYYDGHVVYWTGDRWYTYRDGAWVYYHREPRYLYRYRGSWGASPYRPAPRYYRPHYDRRPHDSYRPRPYQPQRRQAPPARTVAPRAPRR